MKTTNKPAVAVDSVVIVLVGMLRDRRGIVTAISDRKATVQFGTRTNVELDRHILEVAK